MAGDMEIICVGNELLIGKTLNTNAQWIAKNATALGLTVNRVTIVADEVNEIANAVREALGRKPRFIVTTGGLGPTFDDKTLAGIAEALNRKLTVNTEALTMVREKYEAYAREKGTEPVELTQARVKMATLPEETMPVPNPVGTAPSVRVDLEQTTLIALPGVPLEMEAIFTETVAALLRQVSGKNVFHGRSVYVDGVMESGLAPLIDRVMQDNVGVYVKSHPKGRESMPHIEVHLSIVADDSGVAEEKLRRAVVQLSCLVGEVGGTVVFG
jgi:molybdenum cofactor synthesis domain-containing protein